MHVAVPHEMMVAAVLQLWPAEAFDWRLLAARKTSAGWEWLQGWFVLAAMGRGLPVGERQLPQEQGTEAQQ